MNCWNMFGFEKADNELFDDRGIANGCDTILTCPRRKRFTVSASNIYARMITERITRKRNIHLSLHTRVYVSGESEETALTIMKIATLTCKSTQQLHVSDMENDPISRGFK